MPNDEYWDSVECSDQPLDFCFHPKRENILAAALVDGSLEVHHIRREEGTGDEEDDDPDSILSSLLLHTQAVPEKGSDNKSKSSSCRTVKVSTDGNESTRVAALEILSVWTRNECASSPPSHKRRSELE
jgi:hypothetical protein